MRPRLIRANSYRRERWRNDLGWTREIVRYPEEASDWGFRLSIAEIERDCAFSAFPGCDRHLVLLAGNGMTLEFDDGEGVPVLPPHGRIAFAGERVVHCRLQDGPTHDFNVMVRRDRWSAQVLHRPLVGSMVFFAEPGVSWAIYLLAGGARIKSHELMLAPGDTVLLEDEQPVSAARQILDGAGEALLVRLQRLDHAATPGV
jgi:environmental stress-induced protein Ves